MVKDATALLVNNLADEGKAFCGLLNQLAALEQNIGCVDGRIIGTGQADYTQGSTAYTLFVDDNAFALIDIPGIEGDESKYEEIIKTSLAKAHVIFYVNGSGKMIEQDSLKKIQDYMHDGTSVYALFNVHIKGQLQRIPGIDKTLQEELSEAYENNKVMLRTEEELRSFLGDNFKGSVPLNGLLSFCSLAMDEQNNTTIVQDTNKYLRSDQKKFLKEFDGDKAAMRSASQISKVQEIITDKIDHFDEYIREENLKKLKTRLTDMIEDIGQLRSKEDSKIKEFLQVYKTYEQNCENARDIFAQTIRVIGRDVVESAFYPVQEELFTAIENSDGKLKEESARWIFNKHQDQISNDIQAGIKKKIEAAVNMYQESVTDAAKRLEKDMERSQKKFEMLMGAQALHFDTSFIKALKFSGKDFGNGLKKVASYAFSGFSVGSVIPVIGNVVGAIIGAVVGIVMAVVDFFSSKQTRINRAKSKMKEVLDEQIDNITADVKAKIKEQGIIESINQNHETIREEIEKQKKSLADVKHIMGVVEKELKACYQKI